MINSEMYRFEKQDLRLFDGYREKQVWGNDEDDRTTTSNTFRGWRELNHWMAHQMRMPVNTLPITSTDVDGSVTVHYFLLPETLQPIEYIPYLNLGLLTGQGRVQSDTRQTAKFIFGDDRTESVGARARALVKGYSETKSKYLIERFVTLNRDALITTSRSWGLPEALGGLGIPHITNHSTSGLVVAAFLDRASPSLYLKEMSAIKGTELNPPPHVRDALALNSKVLREYGTKMWGTEEDVKQYQLPLLVGATFITCTIVKNDAHRVMNSERAYQRLILQATQSGVRKMTEERLASLENKVVYSKFNLEVKSIMGGWIPTINHRLTS
jgi:hypothetical protein